MQQKLIHLNNYGQNIFSKKRIGRLFIHKCILLDIVKKSVTVSINQKKKSVTFDEQ